MPAVAKITAAVALLAAGLAPAAAGAVTLDQIIAAERAVKKMPLECRPNRLGHVYGNNVRRVQQEKVFVNRGRYERPVARFFYIP